MAKNVNHVSLIKSTNTAITSGDSVFIASGQTGPKLPTPDVLIQGEIAVNLAKGVETLSIKNTDNEIVTFSSDKIIKKVIVDNERITAAALNDLEVNKQDVLTAGQGIDITNNVISATLDVTVDDALDSGSTNPVANSAITSEFDEIKNIIDENELIIASALNDLEERKLDASAYTPTDLTDLYILSGKVDDNAFVTASALNDLNDRKLDASAYTPTDLTGYATEEWVEGKLGSGFTGENSGNTVTKVIEDNELAISAALNDLNDRKLDASAYTPTDLSDLYALSAVVSANSVVTAAALNDLNTRLLPTITGVSFNEQLAYVDDGVAYLDDISAHTHSINEVDGLQASLNSKVSGITVNNGNKVTPTNGVANLTINAKTVGALPTGTTLDGIPDGTNRKLTDYATTIEYYSSGSIHEIRLKNGNTTLATVNANDFIKDGMVNDVTVDKPTSGSNSGVTCLIVTFNTDAGKEDIEIPLSDMFDSSLFYTKTEIDDKLGSGFTGENSGNTVTEIIEENELIVASALNDLEERKLDASAYTPTDLSDLYILSGKVDDNATVTAAALNDLNERLYDKLDASAYTQVEVDFELDSGSTNPVANSAITTTILENEEVVSEALADLDSRISGNTTYINQVNAKADTIARSLSGYTPSGYSYSKGEVEVKLADKLDASAYTPTDLSGYYTKQEIDEDKLGSGFTGVNSGVTVTQAINETETVVAAALNDLNDRIDSLDGDIDALESAIQNIDLPTIDGDSDLWSSGSTGVPATSALTEVLEEIEEVTATALNDLNDKIAEVSGNQLTADSFKTINNESIIGSGNIEIQGGGSDANALSGVSVNGTAASVSNKVANITSVPADIVASSSTRTFVTSTEKTKIANAITGVSLNGAAATVTNGKAEITATIPTALSQLTSAHTHPISEVTNLQSTLDAKVSGITVNSGSKVTPTNGVANLTIDASTVGALPTGTTLDNVADGTTRKLSDYLPLSGGTITGAITFPTASTATDNTKGINFSNGSSVVAHVGTSTLLGFYSSGKIYLRPNGATSSAAGNGSIEVANDGVNVFEKITAEGFIKSGGTATQFLKADGSVDSTTYATNAALTAHTADTTVHVTSSDKTTWNGKQDALSNANVLSGITSTKTAQWDNAISGVSLNGTAATVTNHVAALTGVATTANVSTHSGTTIPSATSSQMHLPAVTAADNGKILMVVNGAWALVNPTTIYTGSGTPSSGQGNDGDIYLQTS